MRRTSRIWGHEGHLKGVRYKKDEDIQKHISISLASRK
jgi:hypothetical protein